jgi:hypothetical protein
MTKEINQGVKIILGRIESHPEEFKRLHTKSRWAWAFNIIFNDTSFISAEERAMVREKIAAIEGEEFTKRVLEELLVDKPDDSSHDDAAKLSHLNVYSTYQQQGQGSFWGSLFGFRNL